MFLMESFEAQSCNFSLCEAGVHTVRSTPLPDANGMSSTKGQAHGQFIYFGPKPVSWISAEISNDFI